MAKVLVTGAAGFVGRTLVPALEQAGHDVIAVRHSDGDVTEPATWARTPAVEHVFHLAAKSFVPESWRDPAGFLHTNVSGTAQGLAYSRACGAHFVFVSGYLYGRPKRLPIQEDDPQEPNNPYALSKSLAEQICAFYATSMGLPVTVVRPFNIYGPGQRPEFLIPTIVDQVAKGTDIRVNDLTPRRDYVHLDDLAAALVRAIERPGGHRVFNIGSGRSYSVRDIIDAIQAAAGTQLPVVSSEQPRTNEIADVRADITRARTLLGWEPRVSFAEGIAQLVRAARGDKAQ
jgi:GDP-4-dehydro-6-deoxy-D-mannose reductase